MSEITVTHHKWRSYEVFKASDGSNCVAGADVILEKDQVFIENIESDIHGCGQLVLDKIIEFAQQKGSRPVTGVFTPLSDKEDRARHFFEQENNFEFYEEDGMTKVRKKI